MKSLIGLFFLLATITLCILGHFGTAFVCFVSGWLIGQVISHFDQLPHDFFETLDEINTQDADLERED